MNKHFNAIIKRELEIVVNTIDLDNLILTELIYKLDFALRIKNTYFNLLRNLIDDRNLFVAKLEELTVLPDFCSSSITEQFIDFLIEVTKAIKMDKEELNVKKVRELEKLRKKDRRIRVRIVRFRGGMITFMIKNVPNVELCHELETLGFPQKQPGFFWVETGQFEYELCFIHNSTIIVLGNIRSNIDIDDGLIKAPTLAELEEFLPPSIHTDSGRYWLEYIISDNHISVLYNRGTFDGGTYDCLFLIRDNNEADARAKAVIELAKRSLIETFHPQIGEDHASKKVTE